MRTAAALACVIACLPLAAEARDAAQVRAFRRQHACPSTGKYTGPCPGWVVDHRQPLCAGGADHPSNMQWLTVEAHKPKTRADRAACVRPGQPEISIRSR